MKPIARLVLVSLIMVLHGCAVAQGQDPKVSAFEAKLLRARPLHLGRVRITGGPLKRAQDLDAEYLLKLEPDRMLSYFRERAGLKPKAKPYGGWDGGKRNLTGHIAGHYLSAVSLMWAATGDARFKERAGYIVKEFREIQARHGDGYLVALDGGRKCFNAVAEGDIRSGGFDLNGLWAPWYVLHKTYAGLRDAYRYAGNRTALEIEIKFAAWADGILSKLTDAQVQKMLNTEFGGMNEVMADLYADTGDKRWLDLSRRFEHRAILDPLKRRQDILPGKHGNTQVPKINGSVDRYAYAGDPADLAAASFFWDRVVNYHSYATGGHGKDEYFGQPGKLSARIDGRTAETCNVYNMLKLTRRLFSLRPDVHYAEFHERALFNHILGSIDPANGSTCYMVPVGRGVRREYSNLFGSFTCCVGSGMESHALHGDGIYYEHGDKLWVNLYVPSIAEWTAAGVTLKMDTDFPEGESATLKLSLKSPKELELALRRPAWAGEGFAVKVNGKAVGGLPGPGSYTALRRTWKNGDTVELAIPKKLHLEPLADNPRRVAIMWGPLVLAGDLDAEGKKGRLRDAYTGLPRVPVFVAADRPVEQWLKPVAGKAGEFRTDGVGRERDVDFMPFYRLHRRTYGAYWDVFTPAQWKKKAAEYAAAEQRRRKLKLATVAYVQPGQMQPERDFKYQGAKNVKVVRALGRAGRRGGDWFSFEVPVDPSHPAALVVTYFTGERRRGAAAFDILVDGQRVGSGKVTRDLPARFLDVEYEVPAKLIEGKKKVTVRFEKAKDSSVAGVYGIRMIRADGQR